MGGKGGGGTTINQPPPIDPGKAMGEYLFGTGFRSYGGVTDPRLQNRLISAERRFRPQYTALELADINVMATGIEGGSPNPEYQLLEAKLAGLEAGAEAYKSSRGSGKSKEALELAAERMFPKKKRSMSSRHRGGSSTIRKFNKEQDARRAAFVSAGDINYDSSADRAAEIARVRTQLRQTPETLGATKGLFDLLEEQSTRAGALQREQLGLQRADDVSALQEFAPQVVDAYRDADPYSTNLADLAASQAESAFERASGPMGFEAQRQVDQSVLGNLGGTAFAQQGRSALEAALGREQYQQGREQFAAGLGQGAFAQSRQLAGDIGMTILGRPSASIGLGGQMLQQATAGAAGPMGPQLFDPNVGINMAMSQRSDNMNLLGAQAQADASRSAGRSSMLGSLGGAAIGLMCWVAREVYGPTNPKWKQFRAWVTDDSPSWFLKLYIKYGERFAKFISDKPRIKAIIRKWMDTKIK